MLLPTHSIILQSNLNREEIEQQLKKITYLSDANFTKQQNYNYLFYGNVSNQDFELENIKENSPFTPHISGDILGVQNNTYLKIKLSEWKHNRIAILYLIILLFSTILFIQQWLNQYLWYQEIFKKPGYLQYEYSHKLYPENPIAWFVAIALIISMFLYKQKVNSFQKKIGETTAFLQNQLHANAITTKELPLVFH